MINVSSAPSSVGVYLENTDLIDNGGDLKVGQNSIGIYTLNTQTPHHTLTLLGGGNISSTDQSARGIYSDVDVISTKNITLLGDNSIGIQTYGLGLNNVKNLSNITIGNSSNSSNPSIAIYSNNSTNIENTGTITLGDKSLGIYSSNPLGTIKLLSGSSINVGNEGTGIYKQDGVVNLLSGSTMTLLASNSIGAYAKSATVNDLGSTLNLGDNTYGFVLTAASIFSNTSLSSPQIIGNSSIYAYADNSTVTNSVAITSSGENNTVLYGKNGSTVTNNAVIDLGQKIGNTGLYMEDTHTVGINTSTIKIGASGALDPLKPNDISYSIGMSASNVAKIYNNNSANIYVTGSNSIGMYGTGVGTLVENHGNIYLDASSASSSSFMNQMVGVFLDNGAKGYNYGNITTASDYSSNSNVSRLIGVVVKDGSMFENHGNIEIKANQGMGLYVNNGIIKNYGTIKVVGMGSTGVKYEKNSQVDMGGGVTAPLTQSNVNGSTATSTGTVTSVGGEDYAEVVNDPTSSAGSVKNITVPYLTGPFVPTVAGQVIPFEYINHIPEVGIGNNIFLSRVGLYVDTLGRTRPIEIDNISATQTPGNSLIIGTEIAEITNSKSIKIGNDILGPFLLSMYNGYLNHPSISSGSLTWNATAKDNISESIMTKIPYTDFATDKSTTSRIYNFSDGLEQRYDMNALDSREKMLFNKLNSIGKNEDILLTQAFDEMMGQQYASTKTRIYRSNKILDRGFDDLFNWQTKSKDSNKIKLIGGHSEYVTNTAGIKDYKNDNTGVVYLREDETMNLGKSQGWYAGLLYDRYKFQDIGDSKEDSVTFKIGVYKSIPFDYNNSLNWTIKGDLDAGTRQMHRKYLVVDEIFDAQSTYYTYGASIENEISKTFRLSKGWSFKPYAGISLGYGRYTDIKENKGQIRLELPSSGYHSIKPSFGGEISYKDKFARFSTLTLSLGGSYEYELGKVGESGSEAKVRHTTADYFSLRTEKNQNGAGVFDFNISIENSKVGFNLGGSYSIPEGEFTENTGIRWIF